MEVKVLWFVVVNNYKIIYRVSENLVRWFLAHPYPMPPNFTGRHAERNILSEWLNSDKEHPLLILRALGGFGKSALAWHWLTHDLDSKKWQKVRIRFT